MMEIIKNDLKTTVKSLETVIAGTKSIQGHASNRWIGSSICA